VDNEVEITLIVSEGGWEAILNRDANSTESGTSREAAVEALVGKLGRPIEHNFAA
jgi:hypothetical protein